MWNLIRSLLVAFALAGFVGQTTVRAMPMIPADATSASPAADCADMPGMSDIAKSPASQTTKSPCKGMTPDCIGKMGCATVATPLPISAGVPARFTYERVIFATVDLTREGIGPPVLRDPPRPLA